MFKGIFLMVSIGDPRAMDGMAGMSWKKRTKTKYNLKAKHCKNNNIKIKEIQYLKEKEAKFKW